MRGENRIVLALQQAEAEAPVAEVCRKYGIAEQTFYRWKKKFGKMPPEADQERRTATMATLRTIRNPGTVTVARDLKSLESRRKLTG
jgi:putative transposase